jgi:hypothetical protein
VAIDIVGDFNDRLGYNEQDSYFTTKEVGLKMIELGMESALAAAAHVSE